MDTASLRWPGKVKERVKEQFKNGWIFDVITDK